MERPVWRIEQRAEMRPHLPGQTRVTTVRFNRHERESDFKSIRHLSFGSRADYIGFGTAGLVFQIFQASEQALPFGGAERADTRKDQEHWEKGDRAILIDSNIGLD